MTNFDKLTYMVALIAIIILGIAILIQMDWSRSPKVRFDASARAVAIASGDLHNGYRHRNQDNRSI